MDIESEPQRPSANAVIFPNVLVIVSSVFGGDEAARAEPRAVQSANPQKHRQNGAVRAKCSEPDAREGLR
jgi:hypothetical protein